MCVRLGRLAVHLNRLYTRGNKKLKETPFTFHFQLGKQLKEGTGIYGLSCDGLLEVC